MAPDKRQKQPYHSKAIGKYNKAYKTIIQTSCSPVQDRIGGALDAGRKSLASQRSATPRKPCNPFTTHALVGTSPIPITKEGSSPSGHQEHTCARVTAQPIKEAALSLDQRIATSTRAANMSVQHSVIAAPCHTHCIVTPCWLKGRRPKNKIAMEVKPQFQPHRPVHS